MDSKDVLVQVQNKLEASDKASIVAITDNGTVMLNLEPVVLATLEVLEENNYLKLVPVNEEDNGDG
jgi:hypothetical protein